MRPLIPNNDPLDLINQQLIADEASLRAIIDHIPNPIWSIDRQGQLALFNKFIADSIHHFFKVELKIGFKVTDILPEPYSSMWAQIFEQVLQGEKWNAEYVFEVGGIKYYSEISGNPVINADGIFQGAIFLAQDITHRKNAEDALRTSEEKFRELAETISDSFTIIGDGRVLYMNPAFEKVYSRSREAAVNNPDIPREWIHPDDKSRIEAVLSSEEYHRTHVFNEQYRILTPEGSVRWIWNRSFPIRNRSGAIYRSVAVASDITFQKELETTLIRTKAQQKALLDNIPHMAWLKNAEGRYISVNESFARYYGLVMDEIVGKNDYELFSEDRAREFTVRDQEVIATGRHQRIEKVALRDSKPVWTETFKTPIFNEQGELLGITGISIDISEQKALEEALRISEERFRSLLQFSSDALTMIDENGIIIFESSLEGKISGFAISELIGSEVFRLVHPDDLPTFRKAFGEVLENPCRTVKVEFRGLKKSGSYVYIEVIFANHLENEQIRGIVMNSRDISRRKAAELKEKQNQANQEFLSATALDFLRSTVDTNLFEYLGNQLIKIAGSSIVIVSAFDEATCTLEPVGFSGSHPGIQAASEILGISPNKYSFQLSPENLAVLSANSKSLIRLKGGLAEATLGMLDAARCQQAERMLGMPAVYGMSLMRLGKLFGCIVLFTNDPNFEDEKQTIETFIFQSSVALHRQFLEQELIKARDKAEESDRIKTTFLANMSHEIRTPMNGILGFAQLLAQTVPSLDEVKEYAEAINNNGRLLINLINDIIDISRIESGQVKLNPERVNLNKLLDEIWLSLINASVRDEKPEVEFVLEKGISDDLALMETDTVRLRQVLNNLLGNALKFTPSGRITMGYRQKDEKILEFFVKDTGIGIPTEKHAAIFERFVQADPSMTRQYGGSGLGLAISRGFVEIMGGNMWVESQANKGSSFFFTLPVSMHQQTTSAQPVHAVPNQAPRKNTVLIVEDDRFNSKYLETLLKRKGIPTEIAFTAREAFSLVEKNRDIALVLMDIQLPVINGLEATRQIKKMRPELPVIAQTANAFDEDRARCLEAGCDDFISKPIHVTHLFSALDKYMKK
jgi:PAS domain S-box-containing protein